ncbi:MAG: hypothetical protein K5841_07390 [Fretibacterium sp.]|nr:hypothetical protein [Fretibacterium sp.]
MNKKMNSTLAWTVLLCLVCLASAFPALALPETAGKWRSTEEYVLDFVLTAKSGDVGRWTQRIYTQADRPGSVEVNLMEGSGPGPLRVPEKAESYDGVIKSRAEYQVLEIADCRAVLERYPYLPLALSVAVSPDAVLTLESPVADEKELAGLAEKIIENLK